MNKIYPTKVTHSIKNSNDLAPIYLTPQKITILFDSKIQLFLQYIVLPIYWKNLNLINLIITSLSYHKYFSNQAAASRATCSKVPGSENKCVAPGIMWSSLGQFK